MFLKFCCLSDKNSLAWKKQQVKNLFVMHNVKEIESTLVQNSIWQKLWKFKFEKQNINICNLEVAFRLSFLIPAILQELSWHYCLLELPLWEGKGKEIVSQHPLQGWISSQIPISLLTSL